MLKIQEIRELIKLIDQSTVNEFIYETDGTKVTMKKSIENNNVQVLPKEITEQEQPRAVQKMDVSETISEDNNLHSAESQKEKIEPENDYDHEIVSPMVGTFYSAPNPESDSYVSVGSKVTSETVVCIVEAMKLFNEIEAEIAGDIVEILVENGELVEYGQPLFRVKTK